MKMIAGIILCCLGTIFGLYVGLWLMFFGGIVDVVAAIRADVFDITSLNWGIAKILCCGVVGHFTAAVLIVPGIALLASSLRDEAQ